MKRFGGSMHRLNSHFSGKTVRIIDRDSASFDPSDLSVTASDVTTDLPCSLPVPGKSEGVEGDLVLYAENRGTFAPKANHWALFDGEEYRIAQVFELRDGFSLHLKGTEA